MADMRQDDTFQLSWAIKENRGSGPNVCKFSHTLDLTYTGHTQDEAISVLREKGYISPFFDGMFERVHFYSESPLSDVEIKELESKLGPSHEWHPSSFNREFSVSQGDWNSLIG